MQKKKFKSYNPKLKEECGVFGISNFEDASSIRSYGIVRCRGVRHQNEGGAHGLEGGV